MNSRPDRDELVQQIAAESASIAEALAADPASIHTLLASEPAAVADVLLKAWPTDSGEDLRSPAYLASILAGHGQAESDQ